MRAAVSSPPLQKGERGLGVALLQAALIKTGFEMPLSTRRTGRPDGIFGDETEQVVRSFQQRHKLLVDGVAGRATISALDAILAKSERHAPPSKPKSPPTPSPAPIPVKGAAPPPSAPTPFVPPANPEFGVGTNDPVLRHDAGAGPWNSKPKEISMYFMHDGMSDLRFISAASISIGSDAAANLQHYLMNSGRPHEVNLAAMINDVPTARRVYSELARRIAKYIENFPAGSWNVTSKIACNGYNNKPESRNWYYAVGGYTAWIKAWVRITGSGSNRVFDFDGQYKFYDRYNWDKGSEVTMVGEHITISDEFMGEFQRQGFAREYDNFGTCPVRFLWTPGANLLPDDLKPVTSR
jgi:hypothetical protein